MRPGGLIKRIGKGQAEHGTLIAPGKRQSFRARPVADASAPAAFRSVDEAVV
jgi:hypothetical protein